MGKILIKIKMQAERSIEVKDMYLIRLNIRYFKRSFGVRTFQFLANLSSDQGLKTSRNQVFEPAAISLPEVELRNTPVRKKKDVLNECTHHRVMYEIFFCRPTNP